MKHPFSEELVSENVYLRTFAEGIDNDELIWHRDHEDRVITVVESKGWKFQAEDKLPIDLTTDDRIAVKAEEWHRVIKGQGNLVVEVQKKPIMKIIKGKHKKTKQRRAQGVSLKLGHLDLSLEKYVGKSIEEIKT